MATMAIGSTGYWLASIGQSLRQRYAVAKELPPSLSTPVSKLDVLKVISCYVVRASRIKSEGGATRGLHRVGRCRTDIPGATLHRSGRRQVYVLRSRA